MPQYKYSSISIGSTIIEIKFIGFKAQSKKKNIV